MHTYVFSPELDRILALPHDRRNEEDIRTLILEDRKTDCDCEFHATIKALLADTFGCGFDRDGAKAVCESLIHDEPDPEEYEDVLIYQGQ